MIKQVTSYTIDEYLALEEKAVDKHEYSNGQVVAMSGGTLNHGIIGRNFNSAIGELVKREKLDCIPINGEVKIFIERANSFVYPDGMLICGGVETYESDSNAVINPILVLEVLSNSTEKYDRGEKFHKYCSLSSFQEYVLIDQYQPVVSVLYRENATSWRMVTTIGLDKSIYLNSIACSMPMADIYWNAQRLKTPQFSLDID